MRTYGAFWLYTLLRFALFFALWALAWLVGVPFFIAAGVALVLSVPLSWVLLARPRQAFAAGIEARVEQRRSRTHDLEARLAGDPVPADDAGPSDASADVPSHNGVPDDGGVPDVTAGRGRRKRR